MKEHCVSCPNRQPEAADCGLGREPSKCQSPRCRKTDGVPQMAGVLAARTMDETRMTQTGQFIRRGYGMS